MKLWIILSVLVIVLIGVLMIYNLDNVDKCRAEYSKIQQCERDCTFGNQSDYHAEIMPAQTHRDWCIIDYCYNKFNKWKDFKRWC